MATSSKTGFDPEDYLRLLGGRRNINRITRMGLEVFGDAGGWGSAGNNNMSKGESVSMGNITGATGWEAAMSIITGNVVQMVLGKLFGGSKTSTYESARSLGALASFRDSRGQMQASMAQQVSRGQRNL